jgi:hypothetical protein
MYSHAKNLMNCKYKFGKTIFVVLTAYVHIPAHHAHKSTSSRSRNICVYASWSHLQIVFLLSGIEKGLVLYGCTGFVVVSAVLFGNHNEQKTGTKFFWGLFIFEQNTLLVLFRKTVLAYFFCSAQPVVAKFVAVSYIVRSFTWNCRYPLQNFQGLFFHLIHFEKQCIWSPLVQRNNFITSNKFSLWHTKQLDKLRAAVHAPAYGDAKRRWLPLYTKHGFPYARNEV